MGWGMKPLFILLALVPLAARAAPPPPDPALVSIMNDIRNNQWSDAQTLAAQQPDQLVGKLVTYYRLLDPGAASAAEIRAFQRANPDWPEQDVLTSRARAAESSLAPIVPPAPLSPDQAWAQFRLAALHGELRQAEDLSQALSGPDRVLAGVWLAFARNDPSAESQAESLGLAQQRTPIIFLARVRALADAPAAAEAIWLRDGAQAAAQADPAERAQIWPAAETFARTLMAAGDTKNAYQIVANTNPAIGGQLLSRDFLAGFIALRLLHEPTKAAPWFQGLASTSKAAITQARAYYWLGRTTSGPAALADYTEAAAYPDTFYGQLAAVKLGDTPAALAARIRAIPDAAATPAQMLDFADRELPQAATLLVQMGAPRRAKIFLLRTAALMPDEADRNLAARLASGLGLTPTAVLIARLAGIDGDMLIQQGWPIIATPPDAAIGPDVILGITRQESSFDPAAMSVAGAEGLMQLLPGTARDIARKSGTPFSPAMLIADPTQNMLLGAAYFQSLLGNFDHCLPLAVAAYNAGPSNVNKWILANGDPLQPGTDMIDWLEEIPFSETNNYVQRVIENIVVYRALRTGRAAIPLTCKAG